MDLFLYDLGSFFWFILTFLIFIILFIFGPELFIKKNETSKELTESKLKIFGIFMGLKNWEIVLFSIRTVSYIFIIYSLFTNDLSEIHFLFLFISLIIFDIFTGRFLKIPIYIFNDAFICLMIFSKQVFWNYLSEINFTIYVLIMAILLTIFIFLYTTYFYLTDIEFIINKNKYIKKVKKINKKIFSKEVTNGKGS